MGLDVGVTVAIALCLFLALAASGVPIGFSLAVGGVTGLVLLRGFDAAGATLATGPYSTIASFGLAAVPMYIFMGALATYARIPQQIFDLAARGLRRVPGGLGIGTLSASVGFAAVTGSSVATAATVARLSLDELRKHGYSAQLASGLIAAGGTLGILIPPSIGLVLFGVVSGESIGDLLIAGVIPGVISALMYVPLIMWLRTKRAGRTRFGRFVGAGDQRTAAPAAGEPAVDGLPAGARAPVKLADFSGVFRGAILFVVVIGGIYSGVFTATESGAIGAFVALLMLIYHAWRRHLGVGTIGEALRSGTSTTSMVLLIVIGGSLFTFFLTSAGVPASATEWASGLEISGTLIVLMLMLIMVPLGMFLDPVSATLVIVPLTYPIVTALGFDGVWWGIMTMKMLEFGMITPPVGMNIFVVSASSPGVRAEDVFRGVIPFYFADVLTITLLFLAPSIVTFLPETMA